MKALLKVQIEDLRQNSESKTYGFLSYCYDPITGEEVPSNLFVNTKRLAYYFESQEKANEVLLEKYPKKVYFGHKNYKKVFKYTYSITKI